MMWREKRLDDRLDGYNSDVFKQQNEYSKFRKSLDNESVFDKKAIGYLKLTENFPALTEEEWGELFRTDNGYINVSDADLKLLKQGIKECKGLDYKKQTTDWFNYLHENRREKYPFYAVELGCYLTSINGHKLLLSKDWIEIVDRNNQSVHEEKYELVTTEEKALVLNESIESNIQNLNLVDSFSTPELSGLKEEFELKKLELENFMKEMYAKQALIRSKLQQEIEEQKHKLFITETDLYALEFRWGLTLEFKHLRKGAQTAEDIPLVVHQKTSFLDEDIPRLALLVDLPSVDTIEELIEKSESVLDYIAPSEKGFSFVKMSRNNQKFSNYNEKHILRHTTKFHDNQIGIVVRNGENIWFSWCDADKIKFDEDSFASNATHEELDKSLLISRYFVMNILLGLLERKELVQIPSNVSSIKDLESSPFVVFSNADSQITDSKYLTLVELMNSANEFVQEGEDIYIPQRLSDGYFHCGNLYTNRDKGYRKLTYGAEVQKGFTTLREIRYLANFEVERYVASHKYAEGQKPSFKIDLTEFIRMDILNSELIDYYILTKRIGNLFIQNCKVDFAYIVPCLLEIRNKLKEVEKEERLLVASSVYDLGLLSSFKLLNGIRKITNRTAKQYEKWVSSLNEEQKGKYDDYLIVNHIKEVLLKQEKERYFVGFEQDGKVFYAKKLRKDGWGRLKGSFVEFATYVGNATKFVLLDDVGDVPTYSLKCNAEKFCQKLNKENLSGLRKIRMDTYWDGENYEKPKWQVFKFTPKEVSKYMKEEE